MNGLRTDLLIQVNLPNPRFAGFSIDASTVTELPVHTTAWLHLMLRPPHVITTQQAVIFVQCGSPYRYASKPLLPGMLHSSVRGFELHGQQVFYEW